MKRSAVALLLCAWLPMWAQEDPAILQLRVLQGEGAVYAAGGRATRGVVVQVTDETGRPVEGATVSFRLPDQAPTGQFSAGGRTEIVPSGVDGRAEVWGMQWGRATGALELRVTAAKGRTRGGVLVPLYLSAAPVLSGAERDPAPEHKTGGGKKKLWIAVGLAAAGVAVAGLAARPAPVPPATVGGPQIGAPTVTIGRP